MLVISTCPKCQSQVSIPAGVDSSALVRCPLCDVEYSLSEAVPPALIPVAGGFFFEQAEAQDRENVEGEVNEAAAVVVGRASITGAPLRRRKPKSALQTIIEIVTGGLAGCLVAYYALAFYYGPEFKDVGLPKLPLPFISALTAPPDEADAGEQEQAAEKPKEPKGPKAVESQTMPEVSESPEKPAKTPAEKSGDRPPVERPPPVVPPTPTQ